MTATTKLQSQYSLIRDCLEGEDEVKEGGTRYLPQPDGMTDVNYRGYSKRASYYGAPASTLQALTGLALRKDPVIKLPARLEPMRINATHDNTPLNVFVEDVMREVLSMGRIGIMLDYPQDGNTSQTLPQMSSYIAETIENYKTGYVDGKKVLTKVVLASDEQFDNSPISLELILDGVYKIRRFTTNAEKQRVDVGEEIVPVVNGKHLTYIPFIMLSHLGTRPQNLVPPMLPLCKIALSHYRNSADREHAVHLVSAPTPVITGAIAADKVPKTIGAGALWVLPQGSTAELLEFTGAGVGAMKELMEEKVDVMAQLGARMMSTSVNRNEDISTATQRTRSELSLLHSAVVSVEAALTILLRTAADWVRADQSEVSVKMSRDFLEVTMDPKQVDVQLKLWMSGAISKQTFYENLQSGEIARADRSLEDEQDMIDVDGGGLALDAA